MSVGKTVPVLPTLSLDGGTVAKADGWFGNMARLSKRNVNNLN